MSGKSRYGFGSGERHSAEYPSIAAAGRPLQSVAMMCMPLICSRHVQNAVRQWHKPS